MNLRAIAVETLYCVCHQGMTLPKALSHNLARHQLPAQNQALLQEICYGSVRWYHRLNALCDELLSQPLKKQEQKLKLLLIVGLYQLLFTEIKPHAIIFETVNASYDLKKKQAKGLVNAILRRAQRGDYQLPPQDSAEFSHPEWLIKQLQQAWPQEWQTILEANNARPPMSLRVNQMQGTRAAYLQHLAEADIAAEPSAINACQQAIALHKPVPVSDLPGFFDGTCSVQNEAAQLAANLLALEAGQRVLDACAAPGGKTGHLLETEPSIAVTALDLEADRLARVQENLDRLQLKAELVRADASKPEAWWDGKPFDRILLDAPCSGTGVIRRHPDIKLLRTADDITALQQTQLKLLSALWSCLRPGGILLYATCSVLPQENEQVIERFLQANSNAKALQIAAEWGQKRPFGRQIFPQPQGIGLDGFYYAKLSKS